LVVSVGINFKLIGIEVSEVSEGGVKKLITSFRKEVKTIYNLDISKLNGIFEKISGWFCEGNVVLGKE